MTQFVREHESVRFVVWVLVLWILCRLGPCVFFSTQHHSLIIQHSNYDTRMHALHIQYTVTHIHIIYQSTVIVSYEAYPPTVHEPTLKKKDWYLC